MELNFFLARTSMETVDVAMTDKTINKMMNSKQQNGANIVVQFQVVQKYN